MAFTAEATRIEMQEHVRQVAALAPEDSRKAALTFVARMLRLTPGRVKQLFYGEARRIEAHEADQIRAYVEAASKLIEARGRYEAERQAFVRSNPRLERLAPPSLERASVPQGAGETR